MPYSDLTQSWEQLAVRQLYNEFHHVLSQRRLALRTPGIELRDSTAFWGRWQPETRTIEFSRRLLLEHPWFHVIAVLKHEMAHQWIDEYGRGQGETPHGPAFQKACDLLGVPASFRGARVNLQEHDLDWRNERADEVSERMLEKTRKLLALAASSNEHEAALAMSRVREIYAKYNLEASLSSDFVHLTICRGSKRVEVHERKIIGILNGHFFVQTIMGHNYDVRSGDTHRMIEIIGRRENVLMAEYVFHFLMTQSESLVERLHAGGRGLTRVQRKSYRLGILEGFAQKLRISPHDGDPTITKALIAFQKDPALANYLSEIYRGIRFVRSRQSRIDLSAYDRGRHDGGRLTLNKPVTSAAGNLGLRIGGRR